MLNDGDPLVVARLALSEWFMVECSARPVIRPHGEETRAFRGGFETRPYKEACTV